MKPLLYRTSGKMVEYAKAIKGHAKLMSAVASSNVPMVTVICGNSLGADNYMMVSDDLVIAITN